MTEDVIARRRTDRLERVTDISRFCCKQDHAQKLDSDPILPLVSQKTPEKLNKSAEKRLITSLQLT